MSTAAGARTSDPASTARGSYAVGVFVLLTLFGYVDRQVFVLLAEPLKHDLALSDTQVGLLQGVGLALVGALASYPIGALADRFDRRWILGLCVAVWSLAVAASAGAQTFPLLLITTAAVGIGEAGLTPIVYASIPELVAARHRQLANSVYTMATQLGVGLAIALCAAIVAGLGLLRPHLPSSLAGLADWRLALLAVASPAPLFIALIATMPRLRSRPDSPVTAQPPGGAAPAADFVAHVRRHWRAVIGFAFGIGLAAFGFGAVMNWVPMIAMRLHGATVSEVGAWSGTATLVATVVGFGIGQPLLQWLAPRTGVRMPIVALWTATASAAVTSAMLLWTTSTMQIIVLQAIQFALIIGAFLVFPTAIQDLAPASLRARMAAALGVVRMLCVAGSPLVVGALSDALKARADGLLVAAVSTSTVSLALGAALLWWSGRHYARAARESLAGGPPS